MNYFAHGIRFVERPWFLAGTATPDWLSAADRRVRLRRKQLEPLLDGSGSRSAELAAGAFQHLEDDRRFHASAGFSEVAAELAELYRVQLDDAAKLRPSFVGHITTELLLDAHLAARRPTRLDAYYDALDQVDAAEVQRFVNDLVPRPTGRLVPFIERFRRARFLQRYGTTAGLRGALDGVLRRVTLGPLPEAADAVLERAREIVENRLEDLLAEPWHPYLEVSSPEP